MLNRAANIVLGLSLLLAPLAVWGQLQGWHYNAGGRLLGVKSRGNNIWVVGAQGLILHSTDRGDTWNIRESGLTTDLRGVSFPDDLHGWAVGDYGYVLRTTDGGFNWQRQTQLDTPWGWGIFFLDSLRGWVCGPIDTVYKTTDGGSMWVKLPQGQPNHGTSVVFVDTLRGWLSLDTGAAGILKTTDGGQTWRFILGSGSQFNDLDMLDALTGWGAGGSISKTTDGWETWSVKYSPPVELFGISIGDSLSIRTCGGLYPATIIQTTDGGSTWAVDSTKTRNDAFYGVDGHLQMNNLTVVGSGGAILRSTNAGSTWRVIRNVDIGGTSLYNVSFFDPNQGWAVGSYGVITHTTNGGTMWGRQVSGRADFLFGTDAPGPQKVWCCGDNGTILGTTDAGITWIAESSNTAYPLYSMDFFDTLFGVAVGGYYGPLDSLKGQGRKGEAALQNEKCKVQNANWTANEMLNQGSRNEFGTGWHDERYRAWDDTLRPWGTGPDFWKYSWRPEETILQTPYRTITRTTNGGSLWIAQNSAGQSPLYGISFVTTSEGWTCGDPQGGIGVILHTTDSGATWQGQSSNVNQGLRWIQFKDRLTGWCVGTNGTALWTTDGGTTWNPGNSGTSNHLWSCAFYDNLNGFACGNDGLLIMTTDGGRNWSPDTSNKARTNLAALRVLDTLHVWAVGSYGMVLGWRLAGVSGIENRVRGIEGSRVQGVKAYPNPFTSFARVPGREKEKFALYDITGRKVGTYSGERIGAEVASGIYFLMAVDREAGPVRIVKVR